MSIEENKALVRRYFEDAPHNPDVCDQIFAPVFRFHTLQHVDNPDGESNPASERATYEWLNKTWGNWHATIDEMIAEGDRVMMRFTFHGVQQGEYGGVPPTYRPVSFAGINIFRIEDGKIAELWDLIDRLWVWQQLGVLPELREAVAKAREAILSQASAEPDGGRQS